jgi:membrane protein implicated in regulation of membrane protease activity
METLMKADIFFFVTTIAVVAVTICLVYAAYYLIRILRNVEEISEEVKQESQLVREDIGDLRANIREEGVKVKHFTNFFSHVSGKRAARAKKEKTE